MQERASKVPSPAFVISLIALFVALGGSAYAVVSPPRNSVGTAQLKNGSVTSAKVKDHSLRAKDFGGKLPSGPPGPGYEFTASTSNPTPSPGTYFVVAEVPLLQGDTPLTGYCSVRYNTQEISGDLFGGAFVLPDNSQARPEPPFSFSGIAVIPAGTQQLFMVCKDSAGNPVDPGEVAWWISPVGS